MRKGCCMLTSLPKGLILKFLTNLNTSRCAIGVFSDAGFVHEVPPEVNQNHSLRAPLCFPARPSSNKKDKILVASTKFLIQDLQAIKPPNNREEIFNWEINSTNPYKCPEELTGM